MFFGMRNIGMACEALFSSPFPSSWNKIFITSTPFEKTLRCQICDTKKRFHWIFNMFAGLFFCFVFLSGIGNILRQNVNNVCLVWCIWFFFLRLLLLFGIKLVPRSIPHQTQSKDYILLTFTKWQIKKTGKYWFNKSKWLQESQHTQAPIEHVKYILLQTEDVVYEEIQGADFSRSFQRAQCLFRIEIDSLSFCTIRYYPTKTTKEM